MNCCESCLIKVMCSKPCDKYYEELEIMSQNNYYKQYESEKERMWDMLYRFREKYDYKKVLHQLTSVNNEVL